VLIPCCLATLASDGAVPVTDVELSGADVGDVGADDDDKVFGGRLNVTCFTAFFPYVP